ncbi:hypothetical protein BH10PAT3_BH10PAT3_2570 [soil metagenome]
MPKTKIKNYLSIRRIGATMALGLLITIKLTGVLSAQSVTQGYGSDRVLQRGMIVGLNKSESSKVEPIDVSRQSNILGVVVNPNDSPITISDNTRHIFVSTSGRYEVLVSDQEGAISRSDSVTVSAIAGIGMKATELQSDVLGRAAQGFDGKTNILSTATLKDSSGKEKVVHIGRIPVEISIMKNSLAKQNNQAPALLNNAGQAIAGKAVSAVRLYLGAIIFIVGTIVAGAILYAGIRSSIISIGRNPLSRQSIFRSMIGVAFTSLFVFLISVIGVYLLLKL